MSSKKKVGSARPAAVRCQWSRLQQAGASREQWCVPVVPAVPLTATTPSPLHKAPNRLLRRNKSARRRLGSMWVNVGSPCLGSTTLHGCCRGSHWGYCGWWARCSACMAARGAATPGPHAHLTAPYQPCCSLGQQTTGQYPGRLGTPVAECTYSAAGHPAEGMT